MVKIITLNHQKITNIVLVALGFQLSPVVFWQRAEDVFKY